MRKFCFILGLSCVLVGCEKVITHEVNPIQFYMEDGKLCMVDNHLHFSSKEALSDFLDSIDDNGNIETKSSGSSVPVKFTCIHDRLVSNLRTKSGEGDGDEMSEEEFELYRAVQLLVEPKLQFVMDTSLVIGAGDCTYKVVDAGTFIVSSKLSDADMDRLVSCQDMEVLSSLSKGAEVELGEGVRFIRTFGEEAGTDEIDMIEDGETKASYGLGNNLHSKYNTTSFAWVGSGMGSVLEFLLIKDMTRYVDLDGSHRLAVQLYNNNFGFVQASGLKTRVQVRKRFLFVPYWVDDGTSYDYANGFNYLYSKHGNYMFGSELVAYAPNNMKGFMQRSWNVAGAGNVDFFYGKAAAVPYISNFGSDYTFVIPKLKLDGIIVAPETRELLNNLYDAGKVSPKGLFSVLQSAASLRGSSGKSALLFVPRPSSSAQFKEDMTLMSGVMEQRGGQYTVRLLSQGGFSWTGGMPSPIQFSMFTIPAIDCFGAVKYNGKWKGVRFLFQN